MFLKEKKENISNIKNFPKKLDAKDNLKTKPRLSATNKINTKDIFGNKSENKIKSSVNNFDKQKSYQKKVSFDKTTKKIDNNNYLSKEIIMKNNHKKDYTKNSKNNSLSKPLNINTSSKITSNENDNKDNNNELYQSKTLFIINKEIKSNINMNSNANIEMNNKTIKNICTNLKYKATTFIPNKANANTNININELIISNPFQRNTLNKSQIKFYNPFNFIKQPFSPMTLEMEKFKKMKMRERENTEKKLTFKKTKKYNHSTNKREKNYNKIKVNNEFLKNKNNFDKYKEYFQTEISEKNEKIDLNLEQYQIQKINKETTIEVDKDIYHIDSNNSDKYNNLYIENKKNINTQEYIVINNSTENNKICSISSSINNLNKTNKNKDSLRNNKASILYKSNNDVDSKKTSSFITHNSKKEKNSPKNNNITLNNGNIDSNKFLNTYENKSFAFHLIKNNKTSNNIKNFQLKDNKKTKNFKKNSKLIFKEKENNIIKEARTKMDNKSPYSKEKLLEKIKFSKNIRNNTGSISNRLNNNTKKDDKQLKKKKLFKIFENMEKNQIKIMKEKFDLWKYKLLEKGKKKIKINSNVNKKKIDSIKQNDVKRKKSGVKYKKLILPEKKCALNANKNKVSNNNNNEFRKEKNLSTDVIIMNNKEDEISLQSNHFIEHKKSFNIQKKRSNIMDQKKQSKNDINNTNIIINDEIQEKKVNNKQNLIIEHEKKYNGLKKSEEKKNFNGIEPVNNKKELNKKSKENERSTKLNRMILDNNINNEKKIIRGFEILELYYYNKLMKSEKRIINNIKYSNNINKNPQSLERIKKKY